jgi:hypothetical protein
MREQFRYLLKFMLRTVVYRLDESGSVNVNDEIGLDPFLSYTVDDHLEDLAGEGIHLLHAAEGCYLFSNGAQMQLSQRAEAIRMYSVDEETSYMLLAAAALCSANQLGRIERFAA